MNPVSNDAYCIELKDISKRFGSTVANDRINLRVKSGSIHGIVGENGAGKSTAMKMLYGVYQPDSGMILVDGKQCKWRSPQDAINNGIGMVHQHFMLAEPYTALDNIILGAESARGISRFFPRAWRWIDRTKARQRLEVIGKQYGLEVPLDTPVEDLPVGTQQRLEILKLLYRDARVLILDEPTAVLTPFETTALFANLRRLRDEGKTILIITHKLREVMELTDEVTVFRAGSSIDHVKTADSSPEKLAQIMVGHQIDLAIEVAAAQNVGQPVLELQHLTLKTKHNNQEKFRLANLDLEVCAGEIVGIAGVEGNGQTELVHAILQPTQPQHRTSGKVKVNHRDVTKASAATIKDLGVGVIPHDRHREGLLLESDLTDNCLLGQQRQDSLSKFGIIGKRQARRHAAAIVREYDVRPLTIDINAGQLSGGNQQKLIIGRELAEKPQLIIAARPTRGVDVGAIEFIHRRLVEARDRGAGVLLISSDLDEIITLSDRVLVMYEGAFVASYQRGQYSIEDLGKHMGGVGSVKEQH